MRWLLLVLIAGCEVAPPVLPELDYAACFEVPLPVERRPGYPEVPERCFHMPVVTPRSGVVRDLLAPDECFGPAIPGYPDPLATEPMPIPMDAMLLFTTAKYVDGATLDDKTVGFEFIGNHNIQQLANRYLWPVLAGDDYYARAPCGGNAACFEEKYGPDVDCYVSVTDCDFKPPEYEPVVLRTYRFSCSSTDACDFLGRDPAECCTLYP